MKKSFIIGFASGFIVAGASLALANSQIQAILNEDIKVTLNGQVQEFKDETTNETQYPITYKDRTYLPLRTVANLVGVDVDYDAGSNTAMLNNNQNKEDLDRRVLLWLHDNSFIAEQLPLFISKFDAKNASNEDYCLFLASYILYTKHNTLEDLEVNPKVIGAGELQHKLPKKEAKRILEVYFGIKNLDIDFDVLNKYSRGGWQFSSDDDYYYVSTPYVDDNSHVVELKNITENKNNHLIEALYSFVNPDGSEYGSIKISLREVENWTSSYNIVSFEISEE